MHDATVAEGIRRKYEALEPVLDERARRQWAAAEAMGLGWGGVSLVACATGISRTTINAGVRELKDRAGSNASGVMARVRRPGGGSKSLVTIDPGLLSDLEAIIAPETRGDPMSPLRWTLKSTSKLAAELTRLDHRVSARTVAALLKAMDYSLQGNRKTREALRTLTAMPSSATSTRGCWGCSREANRWCRWTRKEGIGR